MTNLDGSEAMGGHGAGIDRYTPRRDVSGVPPQGGYVAKRCPLRVQFDLMPPAEAPLPASVMGRARIDEGNAFEAAVFAELLEAHPTALHLGHIVGQDGDERLAATVTAMAEGVELILGGRLPVDEGGRRTGNPDVLVRAGTGAHGKAGYLPIDVKHHKTLAPRERDNQPPALVTPLAGPNLSVAGTDEAWIVRSLRNDALQLAHYHRMLDACGHAGAGEPRGGIIGKERVIAWLDLDALRFRPTWKGDDSESALERYDFEFAFRLDVLAAALAGEHIVEPVYVAECGSCPWYSHCGPRLEESDSISLLPLHGYVQWQSHRHAGVMTRRDLARLDRRTAVLRDALPASSDVTELVARAAAAGPETPVADLVGEDTKQAEVLLDHGVLTAGDVVALDQRALSMHNRMVGGSLAGAIDVARVAAFGAGALHRRRGVAAVDVPAADVEIDIDMENTLDGTIYLWGALLDGTYIPFVDWESPSGLLEARLFVRFWEWITEQRRTAHDSGRRIAFYCWSAGAERGALTSGAALAESHLGAVGAREAVAAFVAGDEFVDLLALLKSQLESGAGNGLKTIAPRAGFAWRDDEPAGELSMLWHRTAVAGTGTVDEVATARRRLLDYNEDDVRATAAVRHWMRSTTFPALEDLDPAFSPSGRRRSPVTPPSMRWKPSGP